MGSVCSKDDKMPFDHLRPDDNSKNTTGISLTAEQQQLNIQILQLIDKNFNDHTDHWTALKQKEAMQPSDCFPSKIMDNIFVGDHRSASNANTYDNEHIGITHVVNCAASEFLKQYPLGIEVLKIAASDDHSYRIIDQHIDEVISFVDEALENDDHKVLFHCLAGVNRSVTLCIAYMMHRFKETKNTADVVDIVSRNRSIGVLSNAAFSKQIVLYDSRLRQQ